MEFAWYSVKICVFRCPIWNTKSWQSKLTRKLKHAYSIRESSEYFCQVSSKSICIIWSYIPSQIWRVFETQRSTFSGRQKRSLVRSETYCWSATVNKHYSKRYRYLLSSMFSLYGPMLTAVTVDIRTFWPVMVTRVPPDKGPYNGRTLSTVTGLCDPANSTEI